MACQEAVSNRNIGSCENFMGTGVRVRILISEQFLSHT